MHRRNFISLIGGAAAGLPLGARAQQQGLPVVGFLSPASADANPQLVESIREGLRETGYVDGRNVTLVFRWAEERNDRLPALATELARLPAKVIYASGYPAARAAKDATKTIPIVFNTGEDPVKLGLVESLNRPGGNVTGVTSLGGLLGAKRIELLREVLPSAKVAGALVNPTNPVVAAAQIGDWQYATRQLGLELRVLHASTEADFEAVFAGLKEPRTDFLVIGPDALTISRSEQLGALALRHGVPAIFQFRAFVTAGGLMSYGSSITDAFRLAGSYAGRILKGERPAVLPVHQSAKVELLINLKTARALGLAVPTALLGRADEVFE
jgi:putative tryptophan/tyrosine transport system substrate-binding protein